MSDTRTMTQKRLGVTLVYRFNSDKMDYLLRDYTGERQFLVSYEDITLDRPSALTVNNRILYRRLLMIPLVALVISVMAADFNPSLSRWLSYSALVVFCVLAVAHYLKLLAIPYTLLTISPPSPGSGGLPIRIIKDKDHDAVLGELTARWRARIRFLHGTPNLSNDPAREAAKFKFMKEKSVITDDEYDAAMKVLRLAANADEPARQSLH